MTELSAVAKPPGRLEFARSPAVADGLDRLGLALADPIRRTILVLLLDGTRRPSELAMAIGTSRSNLSNHLACLRGCGLIRAERSGRHQHYHLVSDELADGLRSLLSVASTLSPCDDHGPAAPASA
ncbi:MAG: metalloregulator ArsR/SmtB family transcription factor [Actinomycetota bacterium]